MIKEGIQEARAILRYRMGRMRGRLNQGTTWMQGKLIEFRGNVVEIDGCKFSVDNSVIATDVKSKFYLGTYEVPERKALHRFLHPNKPVVELGGAIGVVACLVNRRLTDPRRHVVVEANPDIVPLLTQNRARNQCQFELLHAALAYGADEVLFTSNKTNFLGSTVKPRETGEDMNRLPVKAVSLRSIVEPRGMTDITLICDIEGGEADLLDNEADVIARTVRTVMMEVHPFFLGAERAARVLSQLQELGFDIVFDEEGTYVFQRSAQAS